MEVKFDKSAVLGQGWWFSASRFPHIVPTGLFAPDTSHFYAGTAAAEINHAGKLDRISTSFGEPLALMLGKGDGTFQEAITGQQPFTVHLRSSPILIAMEFPISPWVLTMGSQSSKATETNLKLLISSIAVTGDFIESNDCGKQLAAGSNCTLEVSFKPTLTGTRSGAVTVKDNGIATTQRIALQGIGQ